MLKPNMPGIPGMSAMTDTLEFMKNMWGGMSAPGMGIPGMVMPTLSVEEINKQIKDLKAVESWLNVNMNMLRGTIQALEVQSATISTLQSMGQTLSSAVKPSAVGKAASAFPFPFPKAAAAPEPEVDEEPELDEEPEPTTESKRKVRNDLKAEFKAGAKPAANAASKSQASPDAANFAAPLANPAIWWNMLQDQFKQAVNTAMSSEAAAAPSAAKPAPAAPRKRKSPPKG